MPDTLFPAGAELLASGAESDRQIGKNQVERESINSGNIQAGNAELGGFAKQKMTGEQQQQLAILNDKLDRQNNTVTITAPMALGLVKNTGDKEWLKAIDQPMRADVLMSFLTHGINQKIAGKEHKVIKDGKEYTIQNSIDENGDVNPTIVSVGDAPVTKTGADTDKAKADRASREKIAHDKAAGGGAGGGKESSSDKEFEKTYRSYQKDTEGLNYRMLDSMAKSNPKNAQELRTKLDFIEKHKDRFNKIQGTPEDTGGSGPTDQIPDAALRSIQDAKGANVTFSNGQTWKWENGKAVKVSG